ncbi:GIY-YIG nuclease family protein [Candidatus Pelagibacter sp. Uisw_114]|uniref:GIY-YIG nuclease family protein n=1 Tax=Candidatus Pelagibacter sp. Uisw_116 TaxID=3230986 RepID=UPI0000FEE8C0
MYYFTYMLKSITPGTKKTYVGYTDDIDKRLIKHNSNKGAKSTKGYKWLLIYTKKFMTKSEAMSYEYKLKKDRNKRKVILNRYKISNIGIHEDN